MDDERKINGSEFEEVDRYFSKVSRSVCKIKANSYFSSGFFLKYSIDGLIFFCLISNEHVITEDMIKNKDNICIYYDYEFENIVIRLDENERYIKSFRDIKIDATVVQILPKDKINEIYFLSPDLDYSDKNQLNGKQIYIPQYASGAELKNARGIIKSINEDEFIHLVSTVYGSSGSPIFLKDSLKVIGIHKERDLYKEENIGDFISPIFNIIKNEAFFKISLDVFFEKNKYYTHKAKRRITKEINEINKSGDNLFKVWFDLDNCFSSIKGPIGSPYEGVYLN